MLLPGVVGGQVERAGAAGDADAAADAHQPLVGRQRLAGLARGLVEVLEGHVDARDDVVERRLGDGRIAAVARELLLVAIELLEDIRLQVGPGGDVHDLEHRGQRVMVVDRVVACDQAGHAVEQVFEAKHRADAFVERVFV